MVLIGLSLFVAALILTVLAVFNSLRRGRSAPTPRRGESVAAFVAVLTAIAALVVLLVVPVYWGRRALVRFSSDGQVAERKTDMRATLVSVNGPRAMVPLLFPVAVAVLPTLLRRSEERFLIEAIAALVLAAFTIIAGFSIGMFYLPSAASMVLAAFLGRKPAAAKGLS